MTKKLNKLLFLCSGILGMLAMTVMVAYCVLRGGRGMEQPQPSLAKEEEQELVGDLEAIYEESSTASQYLCIPLEEAIKEEQVSIENDLMAQRLTITISGLEKDYFYTHKLSGNIESIQEIAYQSNMADSRLIIAYGDILEFESAFDEGHLYISFVPPREKYDKIIVIDPAHGGDENGICVEKLIEKEVTLDIAMRLKALLDKTDIKVYYTRLSDEKKSMEQIIRMVNGTKADMFLSIHGALEETDTSIYGITSYYNETFFIPNFSSADFAYLVEEKVTKSASAKALGLKAGEESMYLVRKAEVPVALVEVGYFSNRQERILLSKEDYKDRIAKGLYEAIIASYEQLGMEAGK
ncbi:MAG: N-acetylmuramoyl-L-alanine amidase [Lachnospiraceae bacterium]|nr:N-acetylmuramoyl-L-alanine amidase [Lachnospiraceae bacterium]